MEKEPFLSGYCRVLGQSRLVGGVTESGELLEADCCFGNCVHEPNCQIAAKIRELLEQ